MAVYPACQEYLPVVTCHAEISPQEQNLPQTGGNLSSVVVH